MAIKMTKIGTAEITKTTCDFYSRFCGTDLLSAGHGVRFVCSEERDRVLKGYGRKYTIYILLKGEDCFVSFSPKYRAFFDERKACADIDGLIASVSESFPLKKRQLMIFREELISDYKDAGVLTAADYALYEDFFRAAHPTASGLDWLKEYFDEKTGKELLFGYLADGKLVSVCDAPDMPYMEGRIQHTGILTLPEYRRKGYAKSCAALAAHHLIGMGITPQWDCSSENLPSAALAGSVGYAEFARAFVFEE